MPCDRLGHYHQWPVAAGGPTLTVYRCERFCGYCEGEEALKVWEQAARLRRHVLQRHCRPDGRGTHPFVDFNPHWTDDPPTNKPPKGIRKDGQARKKAHRTKESYRQKSRRASARQIVAAHPEVFTAEQRGSTQSKGANVIHPGGDGCQPQGNGSTPEIHPDGDSHDNVQRGIDGNSSAGGMASPGASTSVLGPRFQGSNNPQPSSIMPSPVRPETAQVAIFDQVFGQGSIAYGMPTQGHMPAGHGINNMQNHLATGQSLFTNIHQVTGSSPAVYYSLHYDPQIRQSIFQATAAAGHDQGNIQAHHYLHSTAVPNVTQVQGPQGNLFTQPPVATSASFHPASGNNFPIQNAPITLQGNTNPVNGLERTWQTTNNVSQQGNAPASTCLRWGLDTSILDKELIH
ncbi:hypothetical protein K470DRAFT_270715 [Piedraia hortae CBS 480.64]|uniref:Uncharacterized protein n=1 Tax=Piedraia hortae CBS 480.64 TaxID=1314780 RepID=A0A6A7BZF5_9PEZI|nr:hypothetical protein K470DRAFT_270715 [Piedraia hortae CBS 480.64]